MTNLSLQAVLFDLDGTLVDTAPDFVIAANKLRAEHNLEPLPPETISRVVSNGGAAVTQLALELPDRSAPHFEEAKNALLAYYADALGKASSVYSGLDSALRLLEQNHIPWGVVTNKPFRFAEPLLDTLSLSERCATLICPEHVNVAKPDPEGLHLAASQLNKSSEILTSKNCLYVGDHRRDIEAAENAGCISIAVAYGYIEENDSAEEWGADFVVTSSAELAELLTSLFIATQ